MDTTDEEGGLTVGDCHSTGWRYEWSSELVPFFPTRLHKVEYPRMLSQGERPGHHCYRQEGSQGTRGTGIVSRGVTFHRQSFHREFIEVHNLRGHPRAVPALLSVEDKAVIAIELCLSDRNTVSNAYKL